MSGDGSGGRRRWRLGIVGALVLALAAAATAVVVAGGGGDRPGGTVDAAATGLAGWAGAELRGAVVDEHGDRTAVDLTVTADGLARGTLTRDFGASAEFVADGTRTLLKGNAEWWLWSHPGAAADLAGTWVENPPAAATGLAPVDMLTPRALAAVLQRPGGTWERIGERTVAGQRGVDLYDGDRLAVVAADGPPRLLALDVPLVPPGTVVPRAFVTQEGEEPEEPDPGRLVPSAHFGITEPSGAALGLLHDAIGLIAEEIGGPARQLSPAARDLVAESGTYGPHVLTVLGLLTDPPNRAPEDRLTPAEAQAVVEAAAARNEFATLHQLVVSDRLATLRPLVPFMDSLGKRQPWDPTYKRHFQEAARQSLPREAAPRIVLDGEHNGAKADLLLLYDPADGPSVTRQIKTISGRQQQTVLDRVVEGTRQLDGETGELPLPGSVRELQLIFERGAYGGLGVLDRDGLRRALTGMGVFELFHRDGRRVVDRLVVTNQAGLPEDSGFAREHVFDATDLDPGGGAGGAPAPGPASAPAPAEGLFTERTRDGARGALVDAAGARSASPAQRTGGIDFSSLELRYLAEPTAGDGLQYAFTANPDTGGAGGGLEVAQRASDAFFVWLALPPSTFTVNLNPDEPDRIVDEQLGRTAPGRVLLEADLELKRTAARLIHPDTGTGRQYWDALRDMGATCASFRQWIVPGPAQVHEADGGLYILDAPLEVKMESEYIRTAGAGSPQGCPQQSADVDARSEELFRTTVLPGIVEAVNTAPEYAELRRVYLSRVAAQWYRDRSAAAPTTYAGLVDSGDVTPWARDDGWRPRDVFDAYVRSFTEGEFAVTREERRGETVEVRSFVFGGVDFSRVPLDVVGDADFHAEWPELAAVLDGSFDRPTEDGSGRIWLGSASPPPAGWEDVPLWLGRTIGYGAIGLVGCWWLLARRWGKREAVPFRW